MKKKKILYVTGMGIPIRNILTGKSENEITHSAQFFHPWFKLVQKGYQVDFVVASNFNEKPNIQVDWFQEENIYANVYDPNVELPWYRMVFRRIKRFIKLMYYVNRAISENDYDFIYCKAYYEGLAGNIVANIRGVPCGMRSMGTMLNEDFKKYGPLGAALRRPIEFLIFKLKKEFFIMTNDGTKGDLVFEKWKPKRNIYDFYFWKTGIDLTDIDKLVTNIHIPQHEYIFFAARFDNWKRHDRILKILHELHLRKNQVHLYFAGNITSKNYYEEVKNLVGKYELNNYVHFLGAIKQSDLKLYAHNAIANPLMYDVSNLGNVFFETFSAGSVVIGLNDGSLDEYIVNEENGFIVNNEEEACLIIEKLLKNKDLAKKIRENAVKCANQKFLSIDERFDMEVNLIEKTIALREVESCL